MNTTMISNQILNTQKYNKSIEKKKLKSDFFQKLKKENKRKK
jgi:hypothetical protein